MFLHGGNSCVLVDVLREETYPMPCRFLFTATIFPLEGIELLGARGLLTSEVEGGREAETSFIVSGQILDSKFKWLVR